MTGIQRNLKISFFTSHFYKNDEIPTKIPVFFPTKEFGKMRTVSSKFLNFQKIQNFKKITLKGFKLANHCSVVHHVQVVFVRKTKAFPIGCLFPHVITLFH